MPHTFSELDSDSGQFVNSDEVKIIDLEYFTDLLTKCYPSYKELIFKTVQVHY